MIVGAHHCKTASTAHMHVDLATTPWTFTLEIPGPSCGDYLFAAHCGENVGKMHMELPSERDMGGPPS